METKQKILLGLFLTLIVTIILLTWGSIASGALTLGLLLAIISIAMKKTMDRDPEDYFDMGD